MIADEARPLALLFGALAAGRGVRPRTKRTLLVAIQVERRARRSRSRRRCGWRPDILRRVGLARRAGER